MFIGIKIYFSNIYNRYWFLFMTLAVLYMFFGNPIQTTIWFACSLITCLLKDLEDKEDENKLREKK